MTIVFVFGASGSLIGSASFAAGGWSFSSLIGAAIGGLALLLYLLFDRPSAPQAERAKD
jgi:predicted MFS family arabinose efflux permease